MIEGTLKIQNSDRIPAREIETRNPLDKGKKKSETTVEAKDTKKNEKRDVQEAVDRIATAAQYFDRKIHIEIEKELGITVVKVVDGETNKVIRQIPPEEVIELSKRSQDLKGLLINKEG
ncbi:MAG: flagellar protein FlaG [Nitrospiraceae bacterium]|nr:MAG: flagellar protein FlaG [Nitrospiraceae bacterium]